MALSVAASAASAQTIVSRALPGLVQSTLAACAPAPNASSAARIAAKSGPMPAVTPAASLVEPLCRLFDKAHVDIFFDIQPIFEKSEFMLDIDVPLQGAD